MGPICPSPFPRPFNFCYAGVFKGRQPAGLRDIGDARIEISESLDGEVSPRARRTQPSEPEPLARFIVELSEAETRRRCVMRPGRPGGAWGTEGVIVFGSEVSGLGRVSDQGGTPETITALDSRQEEVGHLWPQFLPGGKLLFTIETAGGADEHRSRFRRKTANTRP